MIELRQYQKQFIADIYKAFDTNRRVCGVMPCGAGKTLVIAEMTRQYAAKGNRVVFMVHRQELIEQTARTFDEMGIRHGIIAADFEPNYELPIQIASVQTLKKRLDRVPTPDFLIVDECHHIKAKTYKRIVNQWKCLLLGLTATPVRMGGVTLHNSFDVLVIGSSVKELIAQGYLAHFSYSSAPLKIDLQHLRLNKFGDFRDSDMIDALDRQDIIGDVVKCYREHADGRQAIVYCINIHHSERTAKVFNDAGIRAAHIDGNTPKFTRRSIIEKFRRGELTVLCNVNLFGEGIDVPNMDCVILTRPTRSFTLYYQQAMRALRIDPHNPNKEAIIVDLVENHSRFMMIDEPIEWTLDPNEIQNIGLMPIKTCPECSTHGIPTGTRTCKNVIANHSANKAIERTAHSLSIVYQTNAPLNRNGSLVLADYKTAVCLEFIAEGAALISDAKVERRRVARVIQQPYLESKYQQLYQLRIECLDEKIAIKEANVSHTNGTSFDTPILCDAEGRVLKYFFNKNGDLICGHIFNIRKTHIDEDGIIVKIYDSGQTEQHSEQSSRNEIAEDVATIETSKQTWLSTKQLNLDGFEPEHEQTELDFG